MELGLTHFRLPTLPCSFPLVSEQHPLYDCLVEDMDAFCRCFAPSAADEKVLEVIRAEKWPLLACLMWPNALDARLPWVTKFMGWFIFLDNEADNINTLGADGQRMALLMQKYISVMQQGPGSRAPEIEVVAATCTSPDHGCEDNLFLSCFAPVWEHFRCNMTPMQYTRLSNRCLTLFTLLAHQSKLREEGVMLTPGKMLELRRVLSLCMVLVPLMEYAIGIDLDESVLNRPEIQEMEIACVDYMVTINDIMSFPREYLSHDFNNLPTSFCLTQGVDLQTAVDLASKLAHDKDRRFRELHAAISRDSSYFTPQVNLFIDGLGYMMSGTTEWSWQTGRYHGLHWVAPPPEARQGIVYLEVPPRFESAPAAEAAA